MGTSNVEEFTRDFADRHGHDADRILSCYRNRETADAYESDVDAGKANGVPGTPYFFVFRGDDTPTATGAGGLQDTIDTKLAGGGST